MGTQELDDLEMLDLFSQDDTPLEAPEEYLGHAGALATPIIQVFSVSIETYAGDKYEIYGSIRGTEGHNTTCFHLYDRGYEDAETICKRGTLSLTGPENGIFFPFVGINLDICLKDRIRDVEVIKQSVNLDSTLEEEEEEEDSFDKLLKVVIQGEYGIIATVYYAIFQFAELAALNFTITKLNQSDRFTHIYGSLVAGYGNSERYCNNDDELNNLRTTLLRVTSDQPMPVSVGNPITLFRYVVVVPSYSSIKLEVNLWNSHGENFIGDQVEVQAGHGGDNMVYIESQCACLQVEVKWRHAYVQLYKKHNVEGHIKSTEDINSSPMQKKRRVVYDQQLVSSPNLIGYPGVTHFENTQVEVFAVRVYGISKGISALCGTIFIDDGLGKIHIYNKDESSFELLADGGLVSIKGQSRPLINDEFCMAMNLKDPVQDIEVSKGIKCWNFINVDMNRSWYNKRLCSVILGKEGFASVYYTIFDFPFIASIEAKIIFDSPDDVLVNVCGYIWAQYNNFKYSTKYENKYFRSRLLNLPQGRSVELKTGSNIPLCKSLVAGPLKSSLLIEADLRITRPFMDGNIKEEAILGIQEFENNMSTTYKDIRGVDYRIEFLVKYSEPD